MGLGAAMGSMGRAWIGVETIGVGAGAEGAWISGAEVADFLAADFVAVLVAVFVVAFLATLVAAFFAVFVATFFAAFLAGVFLTATFLAAFAGLAPLVLAGSSRKSSVLFWLIRSMFGKRGFGGFLKPREKGEDGEGQPVI